MNTPRLPTIPATLAFCLLGAVLLTTGCATQAPIKSPVNAWSQEPVPVSRADLLASAPHPDYTSLPGTSVTTIDDVRWDVPRSYSEGSLVCGEQWRQVQQAPRLKRTRTGQVVAVAAGTLAGAAVGYQLGDGRGQVASAAGGGVFGGWLANRWYGGPRYKAVTTDPYWQPEPHCVWVAPTSAPVPEPRMHPWP